MNLRDLSKKEVRINNYKLVKCSCGQIGFKAHYVMQEWNNEGCPSCDTYEYSDTDLNSLCKTELISLCKNLADSVILINQD